jgi:hypothetical protein
MSRARCAPAPSWWAWRIAEAAEELAALVAYGVPGRDRGKQCRGPCRGGAGGTGIATNTAVAAARLIAMTPALPRA